MTRPQITIRRLMIAVAIAAILLALAVVPLTSQAMARRQLARLTTAILRLSGSPKVAGGESGIWNGSIKSMSEFPMAWSRDYALYGPAFSVADLTRLVEQTEHELSGDIAPQAVFRVWDGLEELVRRDPRILRTLRRERLWQTTQYLRYILDPQTPNAAQNEEVWVRRMQDSHGLALVYGMEKSDRDFDEYLAEVESAVLDQTGTGVRLRWIERLDREGAELRARSDRQPAGRAGR